MFWSGDKETTGYLLHSSYLYYLDTQWTGWTLFRDSFAGLVGLVVALGRGSVDKCVCETDISISGGRENTSLFYPAANTTTCTLSQLN